MIIILHNMPGRWCLTHQPVEATTKPSDRPIFRLSLRPGSHDKDLKPLRLHWEADKGPVGQHKSTGGSSFQPVKHAAYDPSLLPTTTSAI